jgi:Mesyanzhinovviridae DNA helicase
VSLLKTPGFEHQNTYVRDHATDDKFALWWQMGTGKSWAALATAEALRLNGAITAMLLVAPKGLHRNFVDREIPKHLTDEQRETWATLSWNSEAAATKAWRDTARQFLSRPGFKLLAMSYDGLMMEGGRALAKEFLTENKCLYVLDESARIKNPNAKRTVRVLASGSFASYRRIMTGTPISNAPWDAWSQLKFIDDNFWKPHGLDSIEAMKASFGLWDRAVRRVPIAQAQAMDRRNRFGYARGAVPQELQVQFKRDPNDVNKLAVSNGAAFMMVPRQATDDRGVPLYKDLNRLRAILAPIRSRVLKEDVFDLPPKLYTAVDFDLAPEQRRAYDDLRERGFTLLRDGAATAGMALTLLLRLQQIACGYLPMDLSDNGEVLPLLHRFRHNPRLDVLLELVEDAGNQGIIWARFRSDIDQICAALAKRGITYARYDGTMSEDGCAESEQRFHDGTAQWFVSNQAKGGEGLTLVEARTAIYFSNTFKLSERLQSEDRPHRYGQTHAVNVIDLIARGTVDERLVAVLQAKLEVASQVTGDRACNWLNPRPDLLANLN